ncbi:hypothetical protein JI735_34570 (plasmid) [Paenibacillus sonchi]|uniref:Uncharacterized protein n=1 Tax=Paenibacillus sonchi TaxID=373687 RepID=A0A974PII7_9BACL|nr:hypothetical protein [Paenibacillus sonchi]QQZ64560.1 hypothetical protein JI735_34570 [Paenibacillus sonchi]
MIKVVEVLPGQEPVIKEISSLYGAYGQELFGESRRDHSKLGNDLYLAVGDSAALIRKPVNFTLSLGAAQVSVCGPAVFVARVWESDGETFDEYKSLLAGEAAAIVELLKRDRNRFDPSELHKLLGWEF